MRLILAPLVAAVLTVEPVSAAPLEGASGLAPGPSYVPKRIWGSNGRFGWTYLCRFPRHGLVLIDTRDRGSSITYRGKKYPAQGGSYFYVYNDDPEIMVMFKPNMRRWEWADGDAATCSGTKNRR